MPLCPSCNELMRIRRNRATKEFFYGCTDFPSCRGTRPFDTAGDGSGPGDGSGRRGISYQRNEFVHVRHRGFGKISFVEDGDATEAEVEFFTSPADGGTETVPLPIRKVRRRTPPHRHRCFYRKNGRWNTGRILAVLEDEVTVAPAHAERRRVQVPIADVYVRCRGQSVDPVEIIKAGVTEDPKHAKARTAFVEASLNLRSATRGMVGLSSSRIMLNRHQVEVVCRVLRDPLQRYLLADEVGLGKTIEAGAILRQFLLDNPDAEAEILVPPLLLEQWNAELQEKFALDESRLTLSKQGTDWRPSNCEFLIVDEAHHLAGHAYSENTDLKHQYRLLAEAATEARCLLLLSATPLLHNEEAFLGLLHLLDPLLYPLEELEAFKTRVDSRRDLAKRFHAFQATSLDFVLQSHAEAFREMFPDDAQLEDYLLELLGILESESNSDRRDELISLVRVHVSETYKLHRRVLRTRRSSPLAREFPVRGRQDPTELHDEGETGTRMEYWLTDWLSFMGIRRSEGRFDASAEATLLAMLDRWQSAPIVLIRCVRAILDHALIGKAHLSELETQGIQQFEPSERERTHLDDLVGLLLEVDRSGEWLRSLGQKVLEAPPGTVVFCGDSTTAELLADHIEELIPRFDSARYVSESSDRPVEEEIDRFKRGRAHYLICDQNAEEGRNFQYASTAFHVTLPWNPNRIEQRIGRIDRFSSGEPVKSLVCVRPDSVAEQWLRLLLEGFGVFTDSIATLQHVLARSVTAAVHALIDEGRQGLVDLAPDLRATLEEEKDDILQLEHLDSIEDESRLTQGVFDELVEVEEGTTSIEQPVRRWLANPRNETGGIGLRTLPNRERRAFMRFAYKERGEPNMPREVINEHLSSYLDDDSWVTFDRETACEEGWGMLMRPGEAFFDELCALTDADDLGQVYGYWRPAALPEPMLVVQFSFRAVATGEASRQEFLDLGFDRASLDSLMRTVDDYFPPQSVFVEMDHLGNSLTDEIKDRLSRPYGKTDRLLGSDKVARLSEHFELDWANTWQALAEKATEHARHDAKLEQAKSDGAARADRAFSEASLQIQLRLEAESDPRHRSNLEEDQQRFESFKGGLTTVIGRVEPTVEVVGFVLLDSAASGILGE